MKQAWNLIRKCVVVFVTSTPLLHPWAYLTTSVIIVDHRVHNWERLLMTTPHPSIHTACIAPSGTMKAIHQEIIFLVDTSLISVSCDQSVRCLQQWDLTFQFWWVTQSSGHGLCCFRHPWPTIKLHTFLIWHYGFSENYHLCRATPVIFFYMNICRREQK